MWPFFIFDPEHTLSYTLRLAWVKAASAIPTALTEENRISYQGKEEKWPNVELS